MAKDELTDDYVAGLLAKDAKESAIKYSAMGLEAFAPSKPPANKPKPNTRFLRNIIKDTDSHNAALLAKEAAESKARLRNLASNDHRVQKSKTVAGGDIRKRQLGDIAAILGGRPAKRKRAEVEPEAAPEVAKTPKGAEAPKEKSRDETRQRSEKKEESEEKTRERSHRSHRRHRSVSSDRDKDGEDQRKRRRSRSRSPREQRDKEGRHRHRSPRRRRSRSPDEDRKEDRSRGKSHKSHRHRRSSSPRPKSSRSEKEKSRRESISKKKLDYDSDPLDDIIGPRPPPVPQIRSRGRGTISNASGIDSRFSATYDPTVDVQLDPDEENDWDQALEALRDRQKWKQQGADRLRAAGFTDDEIKKWEKGGEKREEDVKWAKKGEGREWDRGKVVNGEGVVSIEPSFGRLKDT